MKLDKIKVVGKFKHRNIREITDSCEYHRRGLTPDEDVSSEVQVIKDKAEELWTDEVKSAWATFQAEQETELEAKLNLE